MESAGFSIVYRSLADLAEDHRGHVSQGRMVIAWAEAIPPVGTRADLRLSVPGGARFELSGPITRIAEGRGFAVELSPESRGVATQIELLVASPAFQQALRVESPSSRNSRHVSRWDAPRIPGATTASARPPMGAGATSAAPTAPRVPPAVTASARPPVGARSEPARSDATRADPTRADPARVDPTRADPAPRALEAAGRVDALEPPTARIPAAATASARMPEATRQQPEPARPAPPPPSATVSVRPPIADDLSLDDDDSDEPADRYDDYDDDDYGEEDGEGGSTTSDENDAPGPSNFRTPGPGEKYVVYVVKVPTVLDLEALVPDFRATAKLTIPSRSDPAPEGALAQLRLTLPGRNVFHMWALVGRVKPTEVTLHVNPDSTTFAKALAFPKSVLGARRLATESEAERGPLEVIRLEEERPKEDESNMPVRRRLARMSMEDKINMALSGSREERMALAMDGNKAIHHYLLKNARISLDEIAFIARLPTMNPDVLGKIAENPAYTQNQTVVKNLIYNPKTPVLLAIKLLDRIPRSEVLNLSKRMSMNARLVQAAKKKIEGPSR